MRDGPLVGISCDTGETKGGKPMVYVAMTYVEAVRRAGGVPVLLPPIAEDAPRHVDLCDAIVTVGGADPDMTHWGRKNHPESSQMSPMRQAYELALLDALRPRRETPVLGVCLGMQLMGLHAGGEINQHLADTLPEADRHRRDARHPVEIVDAELSRRLGVKQGLVTSNHHQGLVSAGFLAIVARSDDGVIEAIADPARPFYLGVQWHPERTDDPATGAGIFAGLIEAARRHRDARRGA